MSFLSFVLSARSYLTLTDAASSSFFKIEHVELQFSLELQNAEWRYISFSYRACYPMCSPINTSSRANAKYSGLRVSQYNSPVWPLFGQGWEKFSPQRLGINWILRDEDSTMARTGTLDTGGDPPQPGSGPGPTPWPHIDSGPSQYLTLSTKHPQICII